MIIYGINLIGVIVAAFLGMAVGMFWYGPLFGKEWMKLVGMTKKDIKAMKKGMVKTMTTSMLAQLTTAVITGLLMSITGYKTIAGGIILASIIWLGYIATTLVNPVLWEKKPIKLYIINSLHYLVALILMAIVLALV